MRVRGGYLTLSDLPGSQGLADEHHLAPSQQGVASREKHLQSGHDGREVSRIDLASRNQERDGIRDARAKIKTRLWGHG